jgi:glutamate synthase (NADPH/NADH) small chain
LAAAQQLRRAGYAVTVYEKADHLGGLLRYGIPDFKIEKSVVERRVEQLRQEGVQFETGVHVGQSPTWSDLAAEHDALLIATGAERPRDLSVPGRDLSGVHLAMTYLTASNETVGGGALPDAMNASGKRVVVLGGGDTGSDCVGTAIRQGATSVRQIELLPAPSQKRPDGNPWPQWPLVFRSSHAHEEGCERDWAWMTTKLEGQQGALVALHAAEVVMQDGRPTAGLGSERFEADLLLLAMGFTGPRTETIASQLGVDLTPRGAVQTDAFRTTVPGVYAAGDAQRGASLIVWAIADGREAARVIDADLAGRERLPRKGQNRDFGGR